MIICIIGLSLIFLLFCLYLFSILADRKTTYYYEKKWKIYNRQAEVGETILDKPALEFYEKKYNSWKIFDIREEWQTGALFGLLSVIICLILILLFTGFKSEGKKDYEEYLLVKETIEYCIDNDITLDNSMLERSIKLNKEIRLHKEQKQNPWLSWFVYNDICDVDEINLDIFK